LIENRVRKLMKEEEKMHNQIAKVSKHSYLADMTRQRVDFEQRFKEYMRQAEMDRISTQRKLNEERRNLRLTNITNQRNAVVSHAHKIRTELKDA